MIRALIFAIIGTGLIVLGALILGNIDPVGFPRILCYMAIVIGVFLYILAYITAYISVFYD